jgi:hypothetical protein
MHTPEENPMTTDPFDRAVARERSARARRRTERARAGFRVHLSVFVVVQVLLFVTWLVTTPGGFPWFVFPFLGWGIGLAAHAMVVFYGASDRSGDAEPAPGAA